LGVAKNAAALQDPKDVEAAKKRLGGLFGRSATELMDPVQKPLYALMLDEVKRLPADQTVKGVAVPTGSGADAASALLAATKVFTPEFRKSVMESAGAALLKSDDPLVVMARGLAEEAEAMQKRQQSQRGRRLDVGRRWIEAQEAWRGASFYPDANGTLRVAIGTVKGYGKADGLVATPRTTVAGLLAKNTGVEPFDSPKALVEAAKSRKTSRFIDKDMGDIPVCFLMDGDTTGGNSGSCIVNGRGELVGLNFDRVFENVVGDFGWSAERSRNIGVDVRYILWCLESVIPAPALVKELGF
jgi:hypothetical protein